MSSISRMLKPNLGALEEIYELDGYMGVASDASVISDDILGVTSQRTGVGEYTLTFEANTKPSAVRSLSILPMAATAVDRVIQLKSVSTSTIVFRTLVGATPTDPVAACAFYIQIVCRKTGVAR